MKGFKPLHDWVLIEQTDLLELGKSEGGIILLNHDFDLYQFDDIEKKVDDIIQGSKKNIGIVRAAGPKCIFGREGDRVIYQADHESTTLEIEGKEYLYVKDEFILTRGDGDIRPGYVTVKISKELRDSLIVRKGRRDDGTEYELFVTMPPRPDDAAYSQYFVVAGEVMAVGEGVADVQVGDIGLLNYLSDNDESIIIGYEGADKLIAVRAETTRHETKEVAYASRKNRRDQIVYEKGDYKFTSDLLGVIRGEQLISIDPYVFLHHESTIVEKKTDSGITYAVDEKIIQREVLAISSDSRDRTGLQNGDMAVLDDFDTFNIILEGRTITAVNDADILGKV